MTKETLEQAVAEAQRFVQAAKTLEQELQTNEYALSGSPLTATVRRRSMDLTRALAKMRRYSE